MSTHPLLAEALQAFAGLQFRAGEAGEPDPTAMYLATATPAAAPSLRTVLLKHHDERGFVFYTHLDGRKGRELVANPQAALLFHWPRVDLGVQFRLEGPVTLVSNAESDAYFASRPRGSQIGAWASHQSEMLESREAFDQAIAEAEQRFDGKDVPRPPGWTGFRVEPRVIEIWYAGEFRLHERWQYVCDHKGEWSKTMLFP